MDKAHLLLKQAQTSHRVLHPSNLLYQCHSLNNHQLPLFPSPNTVTTQQEVAQLCVTSQTLPRRKERHDLPSRMQVNSLCQQSISAPEASEHSTTEQRIPKSNNGQGVKSSRKQEGASTSSAPDGRLCFRCKQLGQLKKDCPELPYCSKYRT